MKYYVTGLIAMLLITVSVAFGKDSQLYMSGFGMFLFLILLGLGDITEELKKLREHFKAS